MRLLTIAYRVYPQVSKNPIVFSEDKLKLVRLGLVSMVQSLRNTDYFFHALVDGCPPEYQALIESMIPADRLQIHTLNRVGNAATFLEQLRLLKSSNSKYVYFAEDDYFYTPDAFSKMIEFANKNPDADFITPYLHPDYFHMDFHRYSFEERGTWRTAGTTCMTF